MHLHRIRYLRPFILFFIFSIISAASESQTPKGLITTDNEGTITGKTRALIVGISKYQWIDSLAYADRDAQVFADYLRQSHFWGIANEDVTLLLNDQAKNGDMITQLARIAQISKPGDNLLFYFSGHGDVETITQFNNGYLLAYDTYSNNYIAGALPISFLKELFVTLLNKEVKIILLTDACRSGKLAGGMKGAEFAASAISNMWKNEIKILSSQPGQLSYEDKRWGNGRGVFSYYLINGLNGEADANKDAVITLAELEMYVGSNVARETNNKQQPIFEGPNKYSTVIVKMNTTENKTIQKPGGNSVPLLQKIKVPEDSCDGYYRQMCNAIEEKKFGFAGQESATNFYRQLKNCTNDTNFLLRANSKLLAGLMNNAQEIINHSFIGKNLVSEEKFDQGINLIDQVIQNNDLRLSYQQHWNNLKRYLFVQGNATWYEETLKKVPADRLNRIIDSALLEEPDAAYLLTAKAVVEMRKENWTKAIQLLNKALEKSPKWLIPKYQLGICYSKTKSYTKALEFYDEILAADTAYTTFECTKCILEKMASWAWETGKTKKGIDYYLLSIDHFPDYWPAYEALYDYAIKKKDTAVARQLSGRLKKYDDTASMRLLRVRFEYDFYKIPFSLSLPVILPLLKDRTDSADYYYTLGLQYKEERQDDDSATTCFQEAIVLDPGEIYYLLELSEHFTGMGEPETAQQLLLEKMDNYKGEEKLQVKFVLATLYLETDKLQEAFSLFREIKEAGFYTCSDLRSLKKTFSKLPEYTNYMKSCRDQ